MKGDSNFHLFDFNSNEDAFYIDRKSGITYFNRPISITNPTSATQAATKQYIDNAIKMVSRQHTTALKNSSNALVLLKRYKKQQRQIKKLEEQLKHSNPAPITVC